MLENKYIQMVLAAGLILTSSIIAFPEPFDMHNSLHLLIEEALEKEQQMSSQDPQEYVKGLDNKAMNLIPQNKPESKETANDVDTGNSQDCR